MTPEEWNKRRAVIESGATHFYGDGCAEHSSKPKKLTNTEMYNILYFIDNCWKPDMTLADYKRALRERVRELKNYDH